MIERLFEAVDKNRKLIVDAHDFLWKNPETGYLEWKADSYLEKQYLAIGYDLVKAENIPGFYTVADTGIPGPEILVLGELDSIVCPNHKDADSKTGAVHACGHNAQSAALLGIAAALKQPGAMQGLCGRIRLCAVPAEELIQTEYRKQLCKEGKIKYFCGKTEFLHRGYFDGVDIALMVHTSPNLAVQKGNVGCISKTVTYKGKSSHAGGNPWDGCNALYAAIQGLNAVNSLRETFKDSDSIRFHPIITHGGDAVNAIPQKVTVEGYVRGATFDAIQKINKKINQALCSGALAVGANVEIEDINGYTPLLNDPGMIQVAIQASELAYPGTEINNTCSITAGSTDMGDLSAIMPTVHPYAPGAKGTTHGQDYYIEDVEKACVGSAKWQLAMLDILLCDGAKKAKEIISDYKPVFKSKTELLSYIDSIATHSERIEYSQHYARVKL